MATAPAYGSDLVVDLLRAVGIEYVALNPGATYRGLHDSLVNYGGNRSPELILTTHEEIAVGDRPRLRQGRRAADGGGRARHRRPAAREHGHLQRVLRSGAGPGPRRDRTDGRHPAAALDRLDPHRAGAGHPGPRLRQARRSAGHRGRAARGVPARVAHRRGPSRSGPVYLCLDAALQEQPLEQPVALPDVARFRAAVAAARRSADARRGRPPTDGGPTAPDRRGVAGPPAGRHR